MINLVMISNFISYLSTSSTQSVTTVLLFLVGYINYCIKDVAVHHSPLRSYS